MDIDKSFSASYQIEVLSSLAEEHEVVYFPKKRWLDNRMNDLLIRVTSERRAPWTGSFKPGYDADSAISKILTWPHPDRLCVISSGTGLSLAAGNPEDYVEIDCFPITHAHPVVPRSLVIFSDFTNLVAYDANSIVWITERLSWDGIEIESVSADSIAGYGWHGAEQRKAPFRVDLRDGSHEGGASPWAEARDADSSRQTTPRSPRR